MRERRTGSNLTLSERLAWSCRFVMREMLRCTSGGARREWRLRWEVGGKRCCHRGGDWNCLPRVVKAVLRFSHSVDVNKHLEAVLHGMHESQQPPYPCLLPQSLKLTPPCVLPRSLTHTSLHSLASSPLAYSLSNSPLLTVIPLPPPCVPSFSPFATGHLPPPPTNSRPPPFTLLPYHPWRTFLHSASTRSNSSLAPSVQPMYGP